MTVAQTLRRAPAAIETGIASQRAALDPLAEGIQTWLRDRLSAGGPRLRITKDVLHGTWLGHPLHPLLTDVPLGAWTAGLLLDLLGARRAADQVITIGVLATVPTALAGLADWTDTEGKQRRTGLVHAALNTVALGLYVGSLLARRNGSRSLGVGLSTAGLALASGAAYLGGALVYAQGTGVSRTAWTPAGARFQVVARESDLLEGRLTRAELPLDGERVPLVLVRRGSEVLALHAVCPHWGASLADGRLVEAGEAVECPWHGSTFRLRDGAVLHGPATTALPRFEARVRDGNIEVRRVEASAERGPAEMDEAAVG